jgi:hypothetical protein
MKQFGGWIVVLVRTGWDVAAIIGRCGWLGPAALLLAAAGQPPDSHAGYSASTYIRFLDPPARGSPRATIPHLLLSFGGAPRAAVMDTGSTGIVVSADAIPDIASLPSRGPASLAYSSSGRIMRGTLVVTAVTIAGADGASITTAPIAVLAVTRMDCQRTARDCKPRARPPHVAMIGVGFGREHDHQSIGTPDKNPFLTVATTPQDRVRRGYVITAEGVHVGLTAEDTAGGFSFVKLMPDPRWPDWQAAPACITVGDTAPACGRLLADTGVSGMYLTVPADRLGASGVANGTGIAIRLGPQNDPQALGYRFVVGDIANPLAPGKVTLSGIGLRSTFVNTGFHLLNGFDYLYDADGGRVGFRPKP